MSKNPLGKPTSYSTSYDPDLLFPVARSEARREIGISGELPFTGVDVWNAWELTWLDSAGKPMVATAEIRISVDSENIIESKSLKLYLNSLAMTRYRDAVEVARIIAADLASVAGCVVDVRIISTANWADREINTFPGACIDEETVNCNTSAVDPQSLSVVDGEVALEELHSHLLYSNCPVTNQPDLGSILIRYSGATIDRGGLLRYLVSYRQHNGFHEACVENIFVDIMARCAPRKLTVYARYNRRGGLDINPFRSNFENEVDNSRLWRQ